MRSRPAPHPLLKPPDPSPSSSLIRMPPNTNVQRSNCVLRQEVHHGSLHLAVEELGHADEPPRVARRPRTEDGVLVTQDQLLELLLLVVVLRKPGGVLGVDFSGFEFSAVQVAAARQQAVVVVCPGRMTLPTGPVLRRRRRAGRRTSSPLPGPEDGARTHQARSCRRTGSRRDPRGGTARTIIGVRRNSTLWVVLRAERASSTIPRTDLQSDSPKDGRPGQRRPPGVSPALVLMLKPVRSRRALAFALRVRRGRAGCRRWRSRFGAALVLLPAGRVTERDFAEQ